MKFVDYTGKIPSRDRLIDSIHCYTRTTMPPRSHPIIKLNKTRKYWRKVSRTEWMYSIIKYSPFSASLRLRRRHSYRTHKWSITDACVIWMEPAYSNKKPRVMYCIRKIFNFIKLTSDIVVWKKCFFSTHCKCIILHEGALNKVSSIDYKMMRVFK